MPNLNFSNTADEMNAPDVSGIFALPTIMLVIAIPVLLPGAKEALDANHVEHATMLFSISAILFIAAVGILGFLWKVCKK